MNVKTDQILSISDKAGPGESIWQEGGNAPLKEAQMAAVIAELADGFNDASPRDILRLQTSVAVNRLVSFLRMPLSHFYQSSKDDGRSPGQRIEDAILSAALTAPCLAAGTMFGVFAGGGAWIIPFAVAGWVAAAYTHKCNSDDTRNSRIRQLTCPATTDRAATRRDIARMALATGGMDDQIKRLACAKVIHTRHGEGHGPDHNEIAGLVCAAMEDPEGFRKALPRARRQLQAIRGDLCPA